jgi:DNA-directed RNA polymerase subunit H (RpoH/RPB5)
MSLSSSQLISIYKSRITIIELLKTQKYDVSEYESFSINEIDSMIDTQQLDMLVSKTTNDRDEKTYVKYYLETKQLRPNVLDDIIEDLFTGDSNTTLTKNDTLIIIIDNEPNDSIIAKIEYLYEKDGIFVVIHNIKRLQFNVLKHYLVPPMRILSNEEAEKIKMEYNITKPNQISEISRIYDPQARAICIRPGQICEIERSSVTALTYKYYRICV